MIHCEMAHISRQTIMRFYSRLGTDIYREMIPRSVQSLEHAHNLALEYEKYLRMLVRKITSQVGEAPSRRFYEGHRHSRTTSLSPVLLIAAIPPLGPPKIVREKPLLLSHRKGVALQTTFSVQQTWSPCLSVLHPKPPYGSWGWWRWGYRRSNTNPEGGRWWVWWGNSDWQSSPHVMRCVLATTETEDDWRQATIFHTFIKSGVKNCKVIIDEGGSMNTVS